MIDLLMELEGEGICAVSAQTNFNLVCTVANIGAIMSDPSRKLLIVIGTSQEFTYCNRIVKKNNAGKALLVKFDGT